MRAGTPLRWDRFVLLSTDSTTRARARLAGLVPIVLAPRSYVACAAIGLACAIAATLARGVLVAELGSNLRWPTYFLSVLIAAVLGGPTGTVAAILASVVLGSTVFVPQPFAYPARLAFDAVSVGLFAAIASCIATVAILLRHALLRVHERTRALERRSLDARQPRISPERAPRSSSRC